MWTPFGSMPADRELAAFGTCVGGLLLGGSAHDLLLIAIGLEVEPRIWPVPLWLAVAFAAIALALVVQVRGWALRAALTGFAVAQLGASRRLSIGPNLTIEIWALVASALLIAAWPHADRRAKTAAIVLFASVLGFKLWLLASALEGY